MACELVTEREERFRAWVAGVKALAPLRAAFMEASAAVIDAAKPHRRAFAQEGTEAITAFGEFVKSVHDITMELAIVRQEGQAGLVVFGSQFKTFNIDSVTETRKRDLIRHLRRLVDQDT
jgi:hypothetical protein